MEKAMAFFITIGIVLTIISIELFNWWVWQHNINMTCRNSIEDDVALAVLLVSHIIMFFGIWAYLARRGLASLLNCEY